MNEYPKCLYLNGDVESAYVVVPNADAEAVKREAGFSMVGEEKAEPDKPKRGRPRKVEQ